MFRSIVVLTLGYILVLLASVAFTSLALSHRIENWLDHSLGDLLLSLILLTAFLWAVATALYLIGLVTVVIAALLARRNLGVPQLTGRALMEDMKRRRRVESLR